MMSGVEDWCAAARNFMDLQFKDPAGVVGKELVGQCNSLWEQVGCGCVLVGMLILLSGLFFCVCPKQSNRLVKRVTDNLFIIACITWCVGVWLYMVGMYHWQLNVWGVAPRAMIASFRMFTAANELARVDEVFRTNVIYMAIFSITHFVAVVISFLFVVKLIGFRFWALLNLVVKSCGSHKTVYVFWSINDASLQLAESIREHEGKTKEKHNLIAFVHTNDISDKVPNTQVGMVKIIDLMNMRLKDEIRIIDIDKVVITNCHRDLGSVDPTPKIKQFFRELNLKCLGRIVRKAETVHLFFLSDDEEKNITSAVKMRDLFVSNPDAPTTVTLYAHARRSTKNEIYNHYSLYAACCAKPQAGDAAKKGDRKTDEQKSCKIKLVDSSNLAVTYLKQQFKHHPVQLVEVNPQTAVVTSPFNALIIGFGEVGRDAFRFLYEFGAFVGVDGLRSPFHCYAIDANMHQIEGSYRQSTSGIVDKYLTLVDTAIGTERYRSVLQSIIGTLNYVVITINDDDLAMATAVRLYQQAIQARENQLAKFRIYVHCRDKSHLKRMQDVATKFNACNQPSGGEIVIFGNPKDLYTYDLIVDDKIEKEAKRYHERYEILAATIVDPDDIEKAILESWNKQKEDLTETEKQRLEKDVADGVETEKTKKLNDAKGKSQEKHWDASFAPDELKKRAKKKHWTYLFAVHDGLRKIGQNFSNSLHKKTKAKLLNIATNDEKELQKWNEWLKLRREHGDYDYSNTKLEDPVKIKLANVARCEHIRWEASHQLMGYRHGDSYSPIAKTHADMRPWDELRPYTKAYDYNVIDTSIELLLEDARNAEKSDKAK